MFFKYVNGGITAAKGYKASGIHCGIRKNRSKKDLALVVSEIPAAAAAVYTQNLVKGAPCVVTEQHLKDDSARAIICNSGIANTCAADGIQKANEMCRITAEALGIDQSDVLVASTGVIGPSIDLAPIERGLPRLVKSLSVGGHSDAAEAIMTTDTVKKEYALEFNIGGKTCTIGGMAKGSGMIAPNMATMLCFISTDAAVEPKLLKSALAETVEDTFNMLSVDGDTSTNDMVILLANGAAGNPAISEKNGDYSVFAAALRELCEKFCQMLAADGEGATKLLKCRVAGAASKEDAKKIAKAVIGSLLVKAAMFGADANWGRVLCALGYSGAKVSAGGVRVAFCSAAGRVFVCENGAGVSFCEDTAKKVLSEKEIVIEIGLSDGGGEATAWGCDLTYDYVRINGDYRS